MEEVAFKSGLEGQVGLGVRGGDGENGSARGQDSNLL